MAFSVASLGYLKENWKLLAETFGIAKPVMEQCLKVFNSLWEFSRSTKKEYTAEAQAQQTLALFFYDVVTSELVASEEYISRYIELRSAAYDLLQYLIRLTALVDDYGVTCNPKLNALGITGVLQRIATHFSRTSKRKGVRHQTRTEQTQKSIEKMLKEVHTRLDKFMAILNEIKKPPMMDEDDNSEQDNPSDELGDVEPSKLLSEDSDSEEPSDAELSNDGLSEVDSDNEPRIDNRHSDAEDNGSQSSTDEELPTAHDLSDEISDDDLQQFEWYPQAKYFSLDLEFQEKL